MPDFIAVMKINGQTKVIMGDDIEEVKKVVDEFRKDKKRYYPNATTEVNAFRLGEKVEI